MATASSQRGHSSSGISSDRRLGADRSATAGASRSRLCRSRRRRRIAYILDTDQEFVDYRQSLGLWNFLFALIYAMFLDRWIKEALLDGASACDEVDALRRSLISPRVRRLHRHCFCSMPRHGARLRLPLGLKRRRSCAWLPRYRRAGRRRRRSFALLLPALSAGEPLSLGARPWSTGRPVRSSALFMLIGGDRAALTARRLLPRRRLGPRRAAQASRGPLPPSIGAAHGCIDCLLLTFVGYGLARVVPRAHRLAAARARGPSPIADWRTRPRRA